MRLKQRRSKKGRIEIIPMIDVVFFLLVFSMLSALSMAEINRLTADVPKSGSGGAGEVNRITVNDIKGKIFLTIETPTRKEQKTLPVEQIGPTIKKIYAQNPGLVVLINCDDNVRYADGAALMDQVKSTDAPMVVPAG